MPIHNQLKRNLNFWQLASIQTASLGIPGIIISKTLASKYVPGVVITSIIIGNLILWLIGYIIISMAARERRNAIENAVEYIGRPGAKLASLISAVIFQIWILLQMQLTAEAIDNSLFGEKYPNGLTATSIFIATLGIIIAFIAMRKSIHVIKNVNTIFLPVLICFYFYNLFFVDDIVVFPRGSGFFVPWTMDYVTCTVAYISFLFAGMVNLPTFFKHARSIYDSYLALTGITIIIVLFQISSIWISDDILTTPFFSASITHSLFLSTMLKIVNIAFLVMLLLCSNLVNIYFSYPSWELMIPKIKRSTILLAVGLMGTIIYMLTRIFPYLYSSIEKFGPIIDNFIANLGTSLVFIYFVRIFARHRPKISEKIISTTAWLIGCIATTHATIKDFTIPPLLVGVAATISVYGLVIFFEEPYWSWKKLQLRLKKNSK